LSRLPSDTAARLEAAASRHPAHQRLLLCVAVSYGGRQELARAARELADSVAAGDLTSDQIDESYFTAHLHHSDYSVPSDPDLVIRTGGQQRMSNFLLYQSAYAELVTHPGFWPDFGAGDLRWAVAEFSRRQRNYGLLPREAETVLEHANVAGEDRA
jgi:undecaprenyl diphosphate synthase